MPERIGVIKLPVDRLHMELTNACNFSCEFCPDSKMKRPRGLMSFDMACSIIDDAARSGTVKTLLFHVMGEPTLYPRLAAVVEYAGRRGLATCLTTNGSRLDESLLNELVQAGLGEIIVSLQTPDEKTFALRGAGGLDFDEYAGKITAAARRFISGPGNTRLTLHFLSSPLRRLIIPIFPQVSIADTTQELKRHLTAWAERITEGTSLEIRKVNVLKQIRFARSFRENVVMIGDRLDFRTRIMGDWSVHFDGRNVNAYVGYCPGIQENFGILWNGDYTFCCTDFDGRTSLCNFTDTSLAAYLGKKAVQEVVKGFNRYRVTHPYCRQCLGDKNYLNAIVKQLGSIVYFKWFRRKGE